MVSLTLWQTRWCRCNTLLYLRTVFTTPVYHVRWSALGDSHSLSKRDGICGMDWGYTSLVSTPNVLWTLEVCQSQITLLPRYGVIAWLTVVMRQWHELCWNRVGSQVCLVSISTAQCRAHTHLYKNLQGTCVTCPITAIFTHSGYACAMQKLRVTFMHRSHLRWPRLDDLFLFLYKYCPRATSTAVSSNVLLVAFLLLSRLFTWAPLPQFQVSP